MAGLRRIGKSGDRQIQLQKETILVWPVLLKIKRITKDIFPDAVYIKGRAELEELDAISYANHTCRRFSRSVYWEIL